MFASPYLRFASLSRVACDATTLRWLPAKREQRPTGAISGV
jgi:hypothetical protein